MIDSTDLGRWEHPKRSYEEWIWQEEESEARVWQRRINSQAADQFEGALAEAVAWECLSRRVDEVHRGPASGGRRLDFLCRTGGQRFVVEVRTLLREAVTGHTGLCNIPDHSSRIKRYAPLDKQLLSILGSKARQGESLEVPYVVFATTLHLEASVLAISRPHVSALLSSRTFLQGVVDEEGDSLGEVKEVTDMAKTAFTKKASLDPARQHVSAMLVGGLGTYPEVRVYGLIHPEALRPLPLGTVRDTAFCYWSHWPPGERAVIAWSDERRS